MSRNTYQIESGWKFTIDKTEAGIKEEWYQVGLPKSKEVTIPHTFNTDPEYVTYRGSAWYEYDFIPGEEWSEKRVRIQFNGVYRDADIWLNGVLIGSHYHSGFSTFTIDMGDNYKVGVENRLVIRVQNHWSKEALPYERSFDWADDGGIYRNVYFILSGKLAFDHIRIAAKPIISSYGERVKHAKATFEADLFLTEGKEKYSQKSCDLRIYKGVDEKKSLVYEQSEIEIKEASFITLPAILLEEVSLWHFDSPQLYTAVFTLKADGLVSDELSIEFGFREFLIEGYQFILNGETVRLCGTEWMPGSHPEYGNAEPVEYLCQNLKQLKESNCVLTRFHWQQDDAVYDWCNRNGMLVQEEIPHWGKVSVIPGRHEIEISKQHVEDMMKSHYNHPSIVMWGVGNELHGQAKEIHELVKELKSYIKERDSLRPVNYVTNTIFEGAATDATSLGDILMINEYIGTWHGDRDEIEELDKIVKENPNRPLIISEFGLCEPAFSGGDRARSELFERKMKIYSKYPQISGIINFCLNDYRTQMGEEGKHQFRRRVHGSVDVFGEPKPSYYKVQEYCSPLKVVSIQNETGQFSVELKVKDTLPSYMVEGYELVIWKEKQLIERIQIPSLKPSEVWKLQVNHQVDRMQIVRPNQSMVQEFIIE